MFKFLLAQVVLTSVTLGALKNRGALTYKPDAIKNDYVRYAVTSALNMGENAYTKALDLGKSLMQQGAK